MSNFEDLIRIKKLEKQLYDNNNKLRFLEQANDKLIEQKKQLKELLKECKDVMSMAGYVFAKIQDVEKTRSLLTKIDNAIGGKRSEICC